MCVLIVAMSPSCQQGVDASALTRGRRYHDGVINAAYLRVYLPVERIGVPYPRHRPSFGRSAIAATEHLVWGESTTEDAFRAEFEGRDYLCPRSPRLRMLEGVMAFSHAYPTSGLLPERAVRHAAAELEALRSEMPAARSHILTSPWHVPLRWFIPFRPEDRTVYQLDGTTTARFRTLLGRGRPKVHRAAEVLEDAGFDDSVIEQVRDLARWLEEFTSEAVLELDYASVARLFDEADVILDDSAEEVAASLAALAEGDFDGAGRAYASVASRWAHAQALTFAN